MNCPVCDAKLREVTKMNVQVDICPDCKGVWLDRGELDKIIELVAQEGSSEAPSRPEARREEYRNDDHRESRESHDHDDHGKHSDGDQGKGIDPRTGRPRKKESIVTSIFDMFGGGD
jgi:hypothetical protein